MSVVVGSSNITINRNDRFLIARPDGSIDQAEDLGFFARDTRFVSGYRVTLNGREPVLLNASRIEHFSVRHEFITVLRRR